MVVPHSAARTVRVTTGVPAALAIVDALAGPLLAQPGNRWMLGVDRTGIPDPRWPGSAARTTAVAGRGAMEALLVELAASLHDGGPAPALHATVTHDEPGDPDGRRTAVLGLQLEVDVVALFREAGPLYEVDLVGPTGEPGRGQFTVGRLSRARRFLDEHLARSPFRPTIVLEGGRLWRLVYVLERPLLEHPDTHALLDATARQVARAIHGAYPVSATTPIPLPIGEEQGGSSAWRLRVTAPARRVDAEATLARARRIEAVAPEGVPEAASRIPLAARMRTLPDDWDLSDLELPGDLRQMLVTGVHARGRIVLEVVPWLVRAMALRRYGWFDVEAVLGDRRFSLATALRTDHGHRGALKRLFLQALAVAPTSYPARLPHGIRRVLEGPAPHPGDLRRYVVRCGPRRAPVEIEVSYDVLVSASRFRRALGNRLGTVPYAVTSEVWTEAVQLALRDPRVVGRLAAGAAAAKPLSELLVEYAATATPWIPGADEGGPPVTWPVLRDGFAVFPLKHLQAFVDARTRGSRVGRAAVAAAVRSAGGENHGPMRFGAKCVRCWRLPIAVLHNAGRSAPHRARSANRSSRTVATGTPS